MKWLVWTIGASALLAFAACSATENGASIEGEPGGDAGVASLGSDDASLPRDAALSRTDAGSAVHRDASSSTTEDGATSGACVHAGEHRMPGTQCCAGEGAGTVQEYALCCHASGGDCDLSTPNPDAFCCFPDAKCNRTTGKCEARTCWNANDNCLFGSLPCCDSALVCDPADAGPFPTSKRCCRPDGLEPPPGQFDCCNTQLHSNDKGKMVCGPPSAH